MDPEYYSVPNARLFGVHALGFDEAGSVIPGTHLWRDDVLDMTHQPYSLPKTTRFLEGTTVSLVNIWSSNYFHWVLENLVQLLYLSREDITHILIPYNPPRYVLDSLIMLDLWDLVIQWDGVPTLVEELYGFGPLRVEGHNYVEGIIKLRSTFSSEFFSKASGSRLEEIYISRKHAGSRRVLNEPALYRLLHSKMTGAIVFPEQFRFEDQVKHFSLAKLIISSHGAGLTNLIWSWEHCRIVEIFGSYHNPCYEKLAADLGHDYIAVDGTAVGDDVLAPLDELEEIL